MSKRLAAFIFGALAMLPIALSVAQDSEIEGTIAFSIVGRVQYAFDVFATPHPLSGSAIWEIQLTDGVSVNYNAQLLEGLNVTALGWSGPLADVVARWPTVDVLLFISERLGTVECFVRLSQGHAIIEPVEQKLQNLKIREVVDESEEAGERREVILPLSSLIGSKKCSSQQGCSTVRQESISMVDRPLLANNTVYFVSTREPAEQLLQSWTAVYSVSLETGITQRLTPRGVSDYSPAISPSGEWIMVASSQGKEYHGLETSVMDLDLYIFKASDGSRRRIAVANGGWPAWKDESTVFFHRLAGDGWWSIFKITLPPDLATWEGDLNLQPERVTPPGVHAFTPAASSGNWLAVATRRPGASGFRHIEIFDLETSSFSKVTEAIHPDAHHYNPFISASFIGYHKCRGQGSDLNSIPRLERMETTLPGLDLLRSDGDFPAISPDGSLIAYIPDLSPSSGLFVMHRNGTGRKKVFSGLVFGTSWDRQRAGRVYTTFGAIFASAPATVQVIAVSFDEKAFREGGDLQTATAVLTAEGTGNNAFPAASPDGREVVFRSGRTGHKNLYIMDSEGEASGLRRLTDGAWTDTMPSWSPSGEWIAFSSDRHAPGSGSFAIWLVRPDGSGLHRLLPEVDGRMNHPCFSPDSKHLVFTANLAGNSAEPVSMPHQFQPYGEIFVIGVDGTGLQRLTHNAYEDGTPTWGPPAPGTGELSSEGSPVDCSFDDVHWMGSPSVGSPTPI